MRQIFFLVTGNVQIYNMTACGKKKVLFVLASGDMLNDSISSGVNTIFCETLTSCRFFVLPRVKLFSLMEQDFQLTLNLLAYQEKKLWRLGHQLKNTSGSIYLERKLAAKLWKLARDFGVRTPDGVVIDIDLSITFLADLLGVSRENASRACKKLVEMGLVAMDRKRVRLPDPDKTADFYRGK